MTIKELIIGWRCCVTEMYTWGDERGAFILDCVVKELEKTVGTEQSETLSLQDASRESGYTIEHLGRLIRAGSIPNAGRLYAPRIKRADLPHRRRTVARSAEPPYDPDADARSILKRRLQHGD